MQRASMSEPAHRGLLGLSPSRRAEGPRSLRGLHRFAVCTAGATFLLLIAGALVTSNDAGLAVPDWPLSYGTWMPPMIGNIIYEHGHRMVAASVGLLTLILAGWLWWREPRRWVRRLGLTAVGLIIAQGVLGGLTVLFLLPRPVSIGHASLAQIFFCVAVSLAVFTGPAWRAEPVRETDDARPPLVYLAGAATLAVFVQLVLGAAFRHGALGLAPHVAWAGVVTVLIFWTLKRVAQHHTRLRPLRQLAWLLGTLLVVQLALGGAAYWSLVSTADAPQPEPFMVALTVAHVVTGALVLVTTLLLTLWAHRLLAPPTAGLVRPGEEPALVPEAEKVTA